LDSAFCAFVLFGVAGGGEFTIFACFPDLVLEVDCGNSSLRLIPELDLVLLPSVTVGEVGTRNTLVCVYESNLPGELCSILLQEKVSQRISD
jgi:hypothetical protein